MLCPAVTCAASNASTMTRCKMLSFVWRESRRHAKAMFPAFTSGRKHILLSNHLNKGFVNKRQRSALRGCGLARRGFATRAGSHGSGVGFANEGFDGVHFGDFKLFKELQHRSITFGLRGGAMMRQLQSAACERGKGGDALTF
jgi:hypothetical protein